MKYFFKFFAITTLIVLTIKANILNVDEENSSLCASLNNILDLRVLPSPIYIEIIDKTFDNCLKPNQANYLTNDCTNDTSSTSKSSLVIVESVEQLAKINLNCINHDGYYLMVIRNEFFNSSKINELVSVFWKRFYINLTFLVIKNSQILLQTFIPFSDTKCDDTELKVTNQFDVETLEWKDDAFFPEKLNNFHDCRITVTTYKNVVPYIVREEYVNGKLILTGRVIEMINALAIALNFTANVDYHPSISAYETCIAKVANREADLFIGNVFLDLSRTTYLDFSIPIFFEFLKFVVPPGRSYSQFENLARTFDNQTWTFILCVVVSCGAIVFIISTRSKDTKVEAFGVGYDNAFMDFIADILGMSRVSMPVSTIPRLVLLKFVIFTFVIRTLYQASLFKFLNSDGQIKPAQSVEDIVSRGYTVYSLALYENYLNLSHHKHARRKFVSLAVFDELLKNISNANFNGALMHTGSLLMYKNGLEERNFTNVFCKEDLMTISMVAYLPKNSFLTEVLNAKIGIFHNAGLIDIWDRRSKNAIQFLASEENTPKPINVGELKAIFLIYLMAAGVSILAFVWEMVQDNLKRKLWFKQKVSKC